MDVSFPDRTATSAYRTVNDVELHTVVAGDESDPLVVLLHGFPEFWYGWHRQIQLLVDAGYRVMAVDQRGYNGSEKPQAVREYRMSRLTRDVIGLIHSEGCDSAHVVGHDWGGVVAWYLAMNHPEVLDRLAILNVPHPMAFAETVGRNPEQAKRSWYMLGLQVPRLPEWLWQHNDPAVWQKAFVEPTPPETFDETDRDRYQRAWNQKGARTGMINWYRAMGRYPVLPSWEELSVPTLLVWGEQDQALLPELAAESIEYCQDGRLERIPEGSHWVHHEFPEQVTEYLCDHLE